MLGDLQQLAYQSEYVVSRSASRSREDVELYLRIRINDAISDSSNPSKPLQVREVLD